MNLNLEYLSFVSLILSISAFVKMAGSVPSSTEDPSGKKDSTPPAIVPVYCLTILSAEEQLIYRNAFKSTDTKDKFQWIQPYFVPWSREDNHNRAEGDLDDMYHIWHRRTENLVGSDNSDSGGWTWKFFIDQKAVQHTGIIIAQPDMGSRCYSEEACSWAFGLLDAERQKALEAKAASDLRDKNLSLQEMLRYRIEPLLEALYLENDSLLGQRSLSYGRVPATALLSIWCNLDIANMDMSELVKYHGRATEVEGEGIVQEVYSKDWDSSVFVQEWIKIVDKILAGKSLDTK